MMKKITLRLLVILIVSFCHIIPASAYVTLQDDGTLVIPQVRIGTKYYTATLKKDSTTSLTPEFALQSINEINTSNGLSTSNTEHSNFYPSTGVAEIPSFLSGAKTYSLALKATDATHQRFVVQHMVAKDEVTWLYMLSGPSVVSFKTEGTYGDTTVGEHFTIDVNENIVQFSDRPHRLANNYPGGITAFNDYYSVSNFLDNPPNVTFAGTDKNTGTSDATVFEMSTPFIYQDKWIMPVTGAIGSEKLPPVGDYIDASFVVDTAAASLKCRKLGSFLADGAVVISLDTDCTSGIAALPEDLTGTYTWDAAVSAVNTVASFGLGHRLPSIYELLGIMQLQLPIANLDVLSPNINYWSSNVNSIIPNAWDGAYIANCCTTNFTTPEWWTTAASLVSKTEKHNVLLVRPFNIQSDPIISECVNYKGRTWELKTNDSGLRDSNRLMTIAEVENYINTMNNQALCGYRDWTLPSLNELYELVSCDTGFKSGFNQFGCNSGSSIPTIDRSVFPNSSDGIYWTIGPNDVTSNIVTKRNSNTRLIGGAIASGLGQPTDVKLLLNGINFTDGTPFIIFTEDSPLSLKVRLIRSVDSIN